MFVHPLLPSSERAHCQLRPVTPPSGSVNTAVNAVSTSGLFEDNVTAPGSSTFVTLTVTTMLSEAFEGSVAVTVTW